MNVHGRILTPFALMLAMVPLSVAQAAKIGSAGDLRHVEAWKDLQAIDKHSLHIIGQILAPTPCYDVVLTYSGESKTLPPHYLLKVELKKQTGACIQHPTPISFHYVAKPYAGDDSQAEVSSAKTTVVVDITTVH